jgi:Flp pilus assembly protein TadD
MDSISLWKKAQQQIEEGLLQEAFNTLSTALETDANNPDIISERAVVIFHLGDKRKALAELDRCVALEPKNPYRYSSRAYIKANLQMIDEAIEDYEICVDLDPNDPIAYNNLGLLLEGKGRMVAAKRNFSRAEELEGILKERGVDLPVAAENIVKEIEDDLNEETKDNQTAQETSLSVAKKVFTKKSVFKEYWSFVMNGFKIKK